MNIESLRVDDTAMAEAHRKKHRSGPVIAEFSSARQAHSKMGFTTRRVPSSAMKTLIMGPIRPRSGDLVLARVDRFGYQTRLELTSGRKACLHLGDEIVIAYGDRYATDQFEAEVPPDLGPTNLVATGGVASRMLSRAKGIRSATNITPIGLVGDARGIPLNLSQFALEPRCPQAVRPRTIAVLGTSMNSGKTTTNRYLVSGLSRAGHKPGATKITGTGSGGDFWVMVDAGAHAVADFTDAGYAATYRIPTDLLEKAAIDLVTHLAAEGCGIILVEIADGLLHRQNIELLQTDFFKNFIDGVLFAAGDSMGAVLGVSQLQALGLPVLGVSGAFTASKLLVQEAASACSVPIYTKEQLCDPRYAARIVGAEQSIETSAPDEPRHDEILLSRDDSRRHGFKIARWRKKKLRFAEEQTSFAPFGSTVAEEEPSFAPFGTTVDEEEPSFAPFEASAADKAGVQSGVFEAPAS